MPRLCAALLFAVLFGLVPTGAGAQSPPDRAVPNGWFFSQAGGGSGLGFAVTDADGVAFWTAFQALGGVPAVGYPVSHRFQHGGFVTQPMQKAIFQWRPESGSVAFVNVFDDLSAAGKDPFLESARQTPKPLAFPDEAGLPFESVVSRRQAVLEARPAVREAYFAAADPVLRFGLPTSRVEDVGNHYAVRLQRAVIQEWKVDVPWARAGEVTIANGGDIAREAGLFPASVVQPAEPPMAASSSPATLPAGWARHEPAGSGVSVALPPGWRVIDPARPEEGIAQLDRANPIEASIADDLRSSAARSSEISIALVLVALDGDPTRRGSGHGLVTIHKQPNVVGLDFDDLMAGIVGALRTLPGVGELSSARRDLPAGPAYELRYTNEQRSGGQTNVAQVLQYYLVVGDSLYMLTFASSRAAAAVYAPIFDEIARGARFTTAAAGHVDPRLQANQLRGRARAFVQARRYAEAERDFAEAVRILEVGLGGGHPEVAAALYEYGSHGVRMGRFAVAEPLLARALAIREQALGADHDLVATTLGTLGLARRGMGRLDEALRTIDRAREIQERRNGPEHPETIRLAGNAATVLFSMGRYAEAEAIDRRLLAIQERLRGPEHAATGVRLNNLGIALTYQGRFAEAEPLLRRAVAIEEKRAPNGLEMAIRLDSLGEWHRRQGRAAEAVPLLDRAVALFERNLPPTHPDLVGVMRRLAAALRESGRGEEAREHEEMAAAIAASHPPGTLFE